jgi:DNA-binding CsgD family transcriptional regulator
MSSRSLFCRIAYLLLTAASNLKAAPIIENIRHASQDERVLLFLRCIDTCIDKNKNDTFMSGFISNVQRVAIELKDERLKDYAVFYNKARFLVTERDATHRITGMNGLLANEKKNGSRPIFIATCLFYIGQNQFDKGSYAQGFENMVMCKELLLKIGYENIPEIGKYLHYLSLDYFSFGYFDKAVELLQTSAQYLPYSSNLDIQMYNTIGLSYEAQAMWDSAARYFKITMAKAERYNDLTWIGLSSGNLGSVYLKSCRYQEAIYPLTQEYDACISAAPLSALLACLGLCKAYIETGNLEKARFFITESERIRNLTPKYFYATVWSQQLRRVKYFSTFSEYYKSIGNIHLAYTYLDSFTIYNSMLSEQFNANQLKLVEKKLEIQKYQLDAELEKQKKRTTTIKNWLLNLGLLLIAVSLVSAYWVSIIKRKKQIAVDVEKGKVAALEERALQQKFLQSEKDLLTYIYQINDKNQLIEKVAFELSVIQNAMPKGEEVGDIAETLKGLYDATLLTNDDWEEFKEKFNSVYPEFFKKLLIKYPDLTASELRLIALSTLNIETKQMGMMLGISAESVRKSKYRIRKKLNLSGDADLAII